MSLFSRTFFKDLLLIYSAEFVVLVSGVAMPGLLARFAGQDQLGIYLLVRRVVGAGVHPLSLGVALALARFLPQEGRQLGTRIRWSLLALFMASTFSLAVLLAVVNWRSAASTGGAAPGSRRRPRRARKTDPARRPASWRVIDRFPAV